ncbi:MAG TPA: hypothetical protein VKY31_09600 [Terriglobia bacterium]|nr:hypothetical protein [Terriglobia bacterium]
MTELELLSSRVLKLENRLRWTTRAAIAAVLLITAGAVMAQVRVIGVPGEVLPSGQLRKPETANADVPPVETEVRSRHFVLTDNNGRDRASLVTDNAGSVFLVMFDASRKTRASLSVGNEGPSLVFYDPSGKARTIVGSTTLVGSHVNENGIAEMSPASSIVLFDKAGKLIWRQP